MCRRTFVGLIIPCAAGPPAQFDLSGARGARESRCAHGWNVLLPGSPGVCRKAIACSRSSGVVGHGPLCWRITIRSQGSRLPGSSTSNIIRPNRLFLIGLSGRRRVHRAPAAEVDAAADQKCCARCHEDPPRPSAGRTTRKVPAQPSGQGIPHLARRSYLGLVEAFEAFVNGMLFPHGPGSLFG